ncbi:blast:RE1-silencing transcription factor [Drosophila guanche]|uniref:Blast:RE1-silencing transcription factor n=1 Tax=Drosophila guanche TaxID=7266 RepID=A0A3B0K7R8_DROGU|nr:blast:RE1-silencing transcription factor [Drosophila guanche]
MDLPSMVQRSGDTLIVRSVVSGNQLYAEQGGHNPSGNQNSATSGSSSSLLERHVERYRLQHLLQQQQQAAAAAAAVVSSVQQQQQQQQQHQQQQQQAVISMDAKEEGLPQCKIKRNYSCNHCAYFTQNPRYHLTHLRDVHGEKIVINKCKLCLYASRHFQKLVRHMKMVHGCTDGIPSGHGQARGKRGMSREARKRRLEESVGVMGGSHVGGQGLTVSVPDVPTLEQVKRELQLQEEKLQRDIEAFNQRQREEQQQMEQQLELANSYERQMQMQLLREFERQSPPEPPTPSPSGSATPPSHCEEPQNRLLKCSACEFTTLYRTQLRAHELAEHGKTKFFRCDKCSYVTHIKARFSKHVKYHSMPMIKCVTCDFRTPYKWNLDRHMKNHGGAGAFKCAACDFTADIKQSLTVHEMNHHVPPVGNAGSIWPRRQNKVGASELCDDFLSDSAELEDQYNNNNVDDDLLDAGMEDPDEVLSGEELHHYGKRSKYDDEEEPTDLSQKGGCSSDTSSVGTATPNRSQRPVPNLIPISKGPKDVLNLSKDTNASRSTLTEIASMFFNEKQISEMLDKSDVPQLSPATTVTSQASSRSQPTKKTSSSFLDKLKTGAQHENLICQCGHVAKCLSESIIHGKSCHASAVIIADEDDAALHEDDADDRLEIDEDDEDHHSHSALNLSVTGSTRCQHCRHRCKSSNDLLHHLTQCVEAIRCANEMYDSNSGESSEQRRSDSHHSLQQQAAVQQQRVCIWNKAAKEIAAAAAAAVHQENSNNNKSPANSQGTNNEENSYYGVETAPGYGEMTPEEEAANSSLKKVYKCPHCSFWASTASRFHVHIVGHLNKKPFECSLCSYRSNWRWDITKHIRLKTIRDPSHKTAKVLMNDETGRRNYTKYNKYITLMKVTEEDGDPKLMKSGEMTPNQVASLAFLKDYAKVGSGSGQDITLEPVLSSKPNALDDAHLADNLIRIPLLATIMNAAMSQQQHQQHQQHKEQQHITPSVTISPVKRSNQAPPSKPSDDLITEVHQEGNEKRTVYRCRKCNFGHHNRDAVLAHVKIHYQDASYPKSAGAGSSSGTSPLQVSVSTNPQYYMNKVFAAMCLGQSSPTSNATNPGTGGSSGSQQHSLISAGLLQRAIQEAQHSPTPNASALSGLALALAGGKSAANTTKASAASILEHGEQKASQNERHCRLKHSGDIRIETLERGGSAPAIYRPLGAGASNESQSHINSTTNSHASTSSLNILNSKLGNGNGNGSSNNSSCAQQLLMSSKQLEQLLHSPLSAGAAAVVNAANTQQDLQAVAAYWAAACKAAVANGEELLQLQQNDQIEITRLPSAANQEHQSNQSNTKSKQQKCPVCPYISESKSQMNYHVSLHKPTQYECRLCTFVCAKKQHLSSHMRSVHQQQLAVGGTGAAGTGGASSLGLDFSVALQLAAAAKQVQQLPASTPLSIDLSQLQLDAASDAEMNPQQLPPEYQYKLISYCPRCPARFAQKHNDERQGKQELEQHLTAHAAANDTETEDLYVCTYCGYRTGEETLLQLHRAVHMSHYQEKCQQLYKNCKEDVEFPAPKLMQITGPETIWVVDSELSVQLLQQQAAGGVSSSTSAAGSFSGQNSLLKKQLESGSGLERVIERESTPQPKPQEAEAEAEEDEERRSSSTPSTSASVATSDLAADGSSDAGSMDMPQSASAPERCLHCPFETQKHEELQQHLPHHGVVQAAPEGAHLCAHCDYHSATEAEIEEHTVVHFNASEKLKSVEFYTCYDNLEISMEQESEEPAKQHTENNNNQDNVINANMQEQQQEQSDTEHRDGDLDEQPPAKKHSTKIILYKSDGALSVKPSPEEPSGAESQSRSENISDRLRRRILRGSAPTAPEEGQEQRPTTPEKMILVNPKTGKVISRK